jgi:Recombination endonuclease VII
MTNVLVSMERNLSLLSDESWLREQYLDQQLSTPAIAELVGCSQAAVWGRLAQFGIPRRGVGRATPFRVDADGRECAGPCGQYLPWSAFHLSKPTQPGGRMSRCMTCWGEPRKGQRTGESRATSLRRMGLTPEDYDWLLAQQGGVCALHGGPETRKGAVYLCVDHDHRCHPPVKRGQTHCCKACIRGLLCHDCNFMVGLAEKTGQAWRFADYLSHRPFVTEEVV